MQHKRRQRPLPPPLPDWFPRGVALLRDPTLNKGTAFTGRSATRSGCAACCRRTSARRTSRSRACSRTSAACRRRSSKYILLESLQDRNEALFFRVIMEHPDEMMPIIYTPTVGLACQQFGHIYRRPRGLYISAADRGRIAQVMRNWPHREARDDRRHRRRAHPRPRRPRRERHGHPDRQAVAVHGLRRPASAPLPAGDARRRHQQPGAARRSALHRPAAEARSRRGATTRSSRSSSRRRRRCSRASSSSSRTSPTTTRSGCCARYRDRVCCFNDDIQGTASVTVAGIFSALRVTRQAHGRSRRFLCLGAGEAATGISDLLAARDGRRRPRRRPQARRAAGWWTRRGWWSRAAAASPSTRSPTRTSTRRCRLPRRREGAASRPRSSASARRPGMFTREVIEEMTRLNERPIVFALSNPTSKSECTAEQAYEWSGGKALFASGSPFDPVTSAAGTSCRARATTRTSSRASGSAWSPCARRASRTRCSWPPRARWREHVGEADLAQGSLYPPLNRRARGVGAHRRGGGRGGLPRRPRHASSGRTTCSDFMRSQMYDPHYASYVA